MVDGSSGAAKLPVGGLRGAESPAATAQGPDHGAIAERFAALLALLAAGLPITAAASGGMAPAVAGAALPDEAAPTTAGDGSVPAGRSLPAGGQCLPLTSDAATQTPLLTDASDHVDPAHDAVDVTLSLVDAARADGDAAQRTHRLATLALAAQTLGLTAQPATPSHLPVAAPDVVPLRADTVLPTPGGAAATPLPADAPQTASAAPALMPGAPDFDQSLGSRVLWMFQHGLHNARVHVHPEHLGPIDIRLKLDGDSAQVSVSAAHAVTRDALEQALPRLRDVLGAAGLTLTQADVSHHDHGGGQRAHDPFVSDTALPDAGPGGEAPQAVAAALARNVSAVGLVDRFA